VPCVLYPDAYNAAAIAYQFVTAIFNNVTTQE